MTSEQIRDLCLQTAKMGREAENGSHDALILMECQFLGEIALQLAIANERAANEHPNKTNWQEVCRCGHPRYTHGASGCSIFAENEKLCGCDGFEVCR